MSDERLLRQQIARDSAARIAALGGVNEEILGIPLEELDSVRELVHETADEFGVDVETEDRIGEQGLVHLAIWRAEAERSGVVGDAAPPK